MPAQRLVVLDRTVTARAQPGAGANAVGTIDARTPLAHEQTALPVIAAVDGGAWLEVRLPARPNGSTGWIPASAGTTAETAWRIVVHRAAHRADVFDAGARRASFPVVTGKPSTPTPLGTFFVTEKLHLAPGVAEGPWALATSAYSDVLRQFGGGPGQIALHGVVGLPAPLGTSASHGCIRFANAAITWIAAHVRTGTPVIVER